MNGDCFFFFVNLTVLLDLTNIRENVLMNFVVFIYIVYILIKL